ncbi:MAG: hypothetical protein KJ834_08215 [Alphaproteobacteria bacterium]|nr:hypothetical protein [Alphaproteobacteria bacterium]
MKCIIYLGHHKTGSSALQEMFTRNAQHLLDNGILYPFVEPEGQAYFKALRAGSDPQKGLTYKVKSPHNHIGYVMQTEALGRDLIPARYKPLPSAAQMFDSIRQAVAETQPHTLLLCSEVFSQYGTRAPALVPQLLNNLDVSDMSFYMTLRRFDLHLASWHSQMLKFGRTPKQLSRGGIKALMHTCHVDFVGAVKPWADAVPREKLFLHNYADIMKAGGSEPHFAQTFGIDMSGFVVGPEITNPSIPYALYDLIRRANHDLPAPAARKFQKILLDHRAALNLPSNAEVEVFGLKRRAMMMNLFTPMQEALGELVGRDGFFPDFDQVGEIHPLPEAEVVPRVLEAARDVFPKGLRLAKIRSWLHDVKLID